MEQPWTGSLSGIESTVRYTMDGETPLRIVSKGPAPCVMTQLKALNG